MRIPDLYTQSEPVISFEFFPPKTDEAERILLEQTVPALKSLGAAYISVTYGAGGGTRERSLRVVRRIREEFDLEAAAHVTCVGSTRQMVESVLDEAQAIGVENILALRGDPPKGQSNFIPEPGGFAYAIDLVRLVKSRNCFAIGVAGYPEGHVECNDKLLDWDRTAAKIAAGADFLITQLFYDIDDFLAFEDYLRNKRQVRVPIVPGVLPFLSAEQIKRFTSLCGAKLPQAIAKRLGDIGADDEAVRRYGVEVCTELCQKLLKHGVPGLHLYCLNRVPSSSELLQNLGLAKGFAHRSL